MTIEERVTLGISPDLTVQEHLARYKFATNFTSETCVLDIACGTGYGTHMLASNAKYVVGLDISPDAINYAKQHYQADNLRFYGGNAYEIPYLDNSFDIIVSFETIEHLDNPKLFLQECKRVLKPKGTFICSTPNSVCSSPTGEVKNPYHVREFSYDEFVSLLNMQFSKVEMYGQRDENKLRKTVIESYLYLKKIVGIEKALFMKDDAVPSFPVGAFKNAITKSFYMVAVCSVDW
jgi:ubiquinone/menaquinone biosynthesis C-methylase UbiE